MKNKKVIYTAIFGGYDKLPDPDYIPEGWDFVCFTDASIQSDVWKIVETPAIYEDSTRNARRCKVLPHRWFPEYDTSLWVDGNILIRSDINNLTDYYLFDANLAVHDHNQNVLDPRSCTYHEASTILQLGEKNGDYKDHPQVIADQMNRYIKKGYPQNNSLAVTMQVLRNHNKPDCIAAMEAWWQEIKYGSKRDQLSFNYAAWSTNLKFNYFDGDSRDNKYFLHTGKHKGKVVAEEKLIEYAPIDIDYYLDMEVQHGGGGKDVCHQYGKLRTVRDCVEYWKDEKNIQAVQSELTPENSQYFNSMMAGYKKGVLTEDGPESQLQLSKDYYESLPNMPEEDVEEFQQNNPVGFDNGFIRHGSHRSYAMIGRLSRGQKYYPFLMDKEQIYDNPRVFKGKVDHQRVFPLTSKVKGLAELLKMGPIKIKKDEFIIVQSGILPLMGLRENNDLDIIISSSARKRIFDNNQEFMRLSNGIEIFAPNYGKFMTFGAESDDDLINNYAFIVDGIRFLEPRFYFQRLFRDSEKDKTDWPGVRRFFELEKYKGYPYNNISLDKWGYEWQLDQAQSK